MCRGRNHNPRGSSRPRPTYTNQSLSHPGTYLVPVELTLTRLPSNDRATLGDLAVDGVPFCFTLEDPVRTLGPNGEGKVYGQTAIPKGRYRVDITYSPKFHKMMIAVADVPFFTGIRIHSGNDADDTLGCILVGSEVDSAYRIHGGSEVLPRLFTKIHEARDQVWLTVRDSDGLAA